MWSLEKNKPNFFSTLGFCQAIWLPDGFAGYTRRIHDFMEISRFVTLSVLDYEWVCFMLWGNLSWPFLLTSNFNEALDGDLISLSLVWWFVIRCCCNVRVILPAPVLLINSQQLRSSFKSCNNRMITEKIFDGSSCWSVCKMLLRLFLAAISRLAIELQP